MVFRSFHRGLFGALAVFAGWAAAARAQPLPLVEIQVTGAKRLSSAAVISASGLAVGQAAIDKDFDAAVARLDETGLFTSIAYRYDPQTVDGKSGYGMVFQIAEAPVVSAVRLDFPGVDEQELWREVKLVSGLVDSQIPASSQCEEYYKRTIGTALERLHHAQDIAVKNEVDLQTKTRTVVFQGAVLPRISGIRFEGNQLIDGRTLRDALEHVAFLDEGYSEHFVRLVLDKNVKPLYEERGRLTVAFPRVSMLAAADGVMVKVEIEEGPEWTLGKVELSGDGVPSQQMLAAAKFPEGRLANWTQIQASLDEAQKVLKRSGYLNVATQVSRSYQPQTGLVDLAIKVNRGQQFMFGTLELQGLRAADEELARATWTIPAGAPLNGPYVDEFLRSLGSGIRGIKSFASQFRVRPNSNVVDVILKVTMR